MISSLIYDDIFNVAVFPCVLWGGEYKIEAIEKFGSNVFGGFYFQLTLSRSDFEIFRIH